MAGRSGGTVDSLSGWPRTAGGNTRDGEPYLRLEALLLSPERAKFGDVFMVLLTFTGFALIFAPVLDEGAQADFETAGWAWAGAMAVLYALRPWWLGRRLSVTISPERMRIGRKSYDRNKITELSYGLHERAQDEEMKDLIAQQEAAMAGKKVARRGRYYRKSWHVMMNYGGRRVDVASIYGRERLAAALRDRIGQMNAVMSRVQALGDGAVEDAPETRYGPRPGID